ncbi:hypothetical protein G9464_11415 [Halostella sp. JP-L12]|uniref:LVIVD repeat-containing protein n=1 Tax=Halostella TaxID=1843185 RepID=UPI000EF82081|nr:MULTISPECIES: hypothetical protein [Halostella]NHN48206.1 hypothetical protein [Halostella sp. JP-L12]
MDAPRSSALRRDVLKASGAALALPTVGRVTAAQEDGYAPLGSAELPGAKELVVSDDGRTAYVALTDGYATVDLSTPSSPEPMAVERNLVPEGETDPLRQIYDVKQDGDRLIVAGPANGTGRGTSGFFAVDVSDPSDPAVDGFYPTDFAIHNCFLRDGYAYLTGNDGRGNPVVVVDVESRSEVARWSPLSRDEAWGKVPAGRRTLHDLYVQDDRAYLVYWDAGTWILDVSDPADPGYVTRFGDYSLEDLLESSPRAAGMEPPGNAHYVQPSDDGSVVAVGGESWDVGDSGSGGPSGIHLWDLSDPASPERVSTIDPEPAATNSYGGDTWTTSHNFDFAGDRLYASWYNAGVKLYDVSDPANPEELAWWLRPDETSFWTACRGVAGEFFVASSLGPSLRETDQAGVFTFPDESGEQADRPSLTEASSSGTTAATETDATTAAPEDGNGSDGGGGSDGDGDSDGGGMPGFGVGAALAGLGLGLRRYGRD